MTTTAASPKAEASTYTSGAPAANDPGTEYVILEATGDPETWKVVGTETARDSSQAVRQHLAGDPDVDGQFVATPARSWKPVSVKTEIALKFGGET